MERVNWRIPTGFVLAPVLPCGILMLGSAALSGQWNAIGFVVISMVTVSWAVIAVFGVPSFLMLRRVKKVSLVDCLAGGACCALLLSLALHALATFMLRDGGYSAGDSGGATYINNRLTSHGVYVELQGLLSNLILGAAIGACFWGFALGPSRKGVGPIA